VNLPRRRTLLFVVLALMAGGIGAWFAAFAEVARVVWVLAALPVALLVTRDTWAALRGGSPGVDVIALLAIVGAVALGETFTAALIALMVAGGGALEEYAQGRARGELSALLSRVPRLAHRLDGEALEDVAVDAVRPGDHLLVKPGEIVPVDGMVHGDAALLDESALTGEPLPVTRAAGDGVRSGGLNAGAAFRLRATATAENSTYSAIVRLVRAAEGSRAPLVRLADRWALWFLPATLAVAGGAWWWAGSAERALAVLVVATPCPLILAAPVALVCGVSRAARFGVIIKGGSALERLARVATVLFDKTGTLTTGTPQVESVEALEGFTPDEVLRLAASLDQMSQHAVAGAIVAAARAADLVLAMPTQVDEVPGGGVSGLVEGRPVVVGGAAMLAGLGMTPPDAGIAARLADAAPAAAWVGIDGRIAGVLLLADRIRPEAPRALRALRAAGIARLVMVTGDGAGPAAAVGEVLGLDAVHANQTPEGKIAVVRAEREAGPVMMIGDGINDAPALASADIGVAMGARGAAAAAEAADVVLLVDRVDRVADAVAIARRSHAIARQSIGVGMGLSLAAMAVAAAGYLPPVVGAVTQEAIDVAVILNALRALGGRKATALPESAGVGRVLDDHVQFRALLARMRRTADALRPGEATDTAALAGIDAALAGLLLPHQRAEENNTFPALARRLGGTDPLAAMTRMHEEIADLATRYGALVAGLSPDGTASPAETHELRRLLHVMEAVIALHLAAEEDLLHRAEETAAR